MILRRITFCSPKVLPRTCETNGLQLMAKIFAFPQTSKIAVSNGLEAFVDDGDLLDFALASDGQGMPLTSLKYTEASPKRSSFDWTNQERADLYRAHALVQAARPGLECDRGISDEGDPWFLIGDQHGDAFIHICRIGREYILDSVTLPHVLTGKDFKSLLDDFLLTVTDEKRKTTEPVNVIRLNRGGVVCLHPSMMIAALVWTILLEIDEATLPTISSLNVNEGSNSTQDTTSSLEILTASNVADTDTIIDQESHVKLASGLNDELSQLPRDEKSLHATAPNFAYALSTIAAAVGLYTGAQALNALWNLTESQQNPSNILGISETAEQNNSANVTVAPDPLITVFTALSQFVDFNLIKAGEEYTANQTNALDENAVLSDVTALKVSTALEVFTQAPVLPYNFAKEITLSATGDLHKTNEFSETETAAVSFVEQLEPETPNSTDLQQDSQWTFSSETTVKNILTTLKLENFNINHANALSLKDWGVTSDYKSSETYGIIETSLNVESTLKFNLVSDLDATSDDQISVQSTPHYTYFSDDAREFIRHKLENYDMEIIVFDNEIIILDKAASMGDVSSVSWQLDDGNVISVIGVSTELSDFLVV